MAFTQSQIGRLTIDSQEQGLSRYRVEGFDVQAETSANLFEIRPGTWRYVITQSKHAFHSPDLFESAEEALQELKLWLLGEGVCVMYEEGLPPYLESYLMDYWEDAGQKGFRSIQVSRSGNTASPKPQDLEITIHITNPLGKREVKTFGWEDADSSLKTLLGPVGQ